MKRTSSRRAPAPTSPCAPPPPPNARRLGRADLAVDTVLLARDLIGKLLVRVVAGEQRIGRIVETEAYTPGDPASHSYRGLTPRTRVMFGPHAFTYVYFIYGTNWCLNIVSEIDGVGAGVLVRACEPLAGLDAMRAARGRPLPDDALARGPGNLCRAFAIGGADDGRDLDLDRELWLADDGVRPDVGTSVRIGLRRAAEAPLRFYARGSRAVSGPRALSP